MHFFSRAFKMCITDPVFEGQFNHLSANRPNICGGKVESIMFYTSSGFKATVELLRWKTSLHVEREFSVLLSVLEADRCWLCFTLQWHLFRLCPLQKSSAIGLTTRCGGSRSSAGCCGRPGPWRNMASTPTPSFSSCPNTSPWGCVCPTALPWGSEPASPTPSSRPSWASAECSVSFSFFLSLTLFFFLSFFLLTVHTASREDRTCAKVTLTVGLCTKFHILVKK